MKIIAINGSPRKHHNSDLMLHKWVDGVRSVAPDADIQIVNLYDLKFTGCRSCFACKLVGGKFYGTCPIPDGIHDLLADIRKADAVAIASPNYFGDLNAQTKCMLERMLFSAMTYSGKILTEKPVDFTMIYTMNATEEQSEQYGQTANMDHADSIISRMYLRPVRRVVAYFTYQFDDYGKYEVTYFKEEDKRRYREEQFPKDLQRAFDTGAAVARDIPLKFWAKNTEL